MFFIIILHQEQVKALRKGEPQALQSILANLKVGDDYAFVKCFISIVCMIHCQSNAMDLLVGCTSVIVIHYRCDCDVYLMSGLGTTLRHIYEWIEYHMNTY